MQRTNTTTWNVADPITAARLNWINADLDKLFAEISNDNVTLTYDIQGQLSQIVDNENSITINIDWSQWNSNPTKLFFQKVWDPKKFTVSYSSAGYPSTIVYA